MKYTTFYVHDQKIELFNTFYGKEIVKVNGDVVSSAWSILGGNHLFNIKGENGPISCQLTIYTTFYGMAYDLYIGGEPLLVSQKSGCLVSFLLGFVMIVALVLFFRWLG